MPAHNELAAKLLRDAAAFFKTIAEQNPPLKDQMDENSDVFEQVADLISADNNRLYPIDFLKSRTQKLPELTPQNKTGIFFAEFFYVLKPEKSTPNDDFFSYRRISF